MKQWKEYWIIPEITLTTRMLTKNGWKHTEDYEWYIPGQHIPFLQEWEDGTFSYNINGYECTIETVSDLLDLLRFVGRGDLAVKFKIYQKDKNNETVMK